MKRAREKRRERNWKLKICREVWLTLEMDGLEALPPTTYTLI